VQYFIMYWQLCAKFLSCVFYELQTGKHVLNTSTLPSHMIKTPHVIIDSILILFTFYESRLSVVRWEKS